MSKQKGFTVVEVLVVILIFSVVGFAAYLVWNNSRSETPASSDNSNTQQEESTDESQEAPADTEEESETSTWQDESNSSVGYSFQYPEEATWETYIYETDSSSAAYSEGERIASAGVNYNDCGTNCGLVLSFSVYVKGSTSDVGENHVEDNMMNGNSFYSLSSKSAVTVSGFAGTRWLYTPADDSAAEIIYYYFSDDEHSYFVQINTNGAKPSGVDLTAYGEQIFATFKLL